MSEVWPPAPENQPEIAAPAASLRRCLATIVSSGLLYSCLGTLLLLLVMLVFVRRRFLHSISVQEDLLSCCGLALFSLTFVLVGGSLGYAHKRTANGFAALVVSSAPLCLSFGVVLAGCL